MGTTGRGKTTTMNLFTGQQAPTGGTAHRVTNHNIIYKVTYLTKFDKCK